MTTEKIIRNVSITSKYIPMLAEFMAKNDIRYYLNGIKVEPHPEKGIFLIATDGHMLTVIHDQQGSTNGEYICELPKKIIAACKEKRSRNILVNPEVLRFVGDAGYVLTSRDIDPIEISRFHIEVAHCEIVDGKFPDWRKVIPTEVNPVERIAFNMSLISRIERAAKACGSTYIQLQFKSDTEAIVIKSIAVPEMFIVVMPMRTDESSVMSEPLPAWLKPHLQLIESFKKAA